MRKQRKIGFLKGTHPFSEEWKSRVLEAYLEGRPVFKTRNIMAYIDSFNDGTVNTDRYILEHVALDRIIRNEWRAKNKDKMALYMRRYRAKKKALKEKQYAELFKAKEGIG